MVDVTGDLEVREDGGLTVLTEMEPLGELTISTHGQGDLVSGSVRVVSEGPIGGMLRFDLPDIGMAVVGAGQPVRDALFPVRRREGGINTGVAIHNLESSPGLVRCDLLREGVLLDIVSIPLEANGQTSWLIDTAFPNTDTSDFTGSVRCDAVGEELFSAVAPGNGPRHPHLHHPAAVSAGREAGSGIDARQRVFLFCLRAVGECAMQRERGGLIPVGDAVFGLPGPGPPQSAANGTTVLHPLRSGEADCMSFQNPSSERLPVAEHGMAVRDPSHSVLRNISPTSV